MAHPNVGRRKTQSCMKGGGEFSATTTTPHYYYYYYYYYYCEWLGDMSVASVIPYCFLS